MNQINLKKQKTNKQTKTFDGMSFNLEDYMYIRSRV